MGRVKARPFVVIDRTAVIRDIVRVLVGAVAGVLIGLAVVKFLR